jgi:hypothetical protein
MDKKAWKSITLNIQADADISSDGMAAATNVKDAPQTASTGHVASRVTSKSGVALLTLDKEADFSGSMKVLREEGLRPLKAQEVLPLLMTDPVLRKALEAKNFYVAEEGKDKIPWEQIRDHGYFTVNAKREIAWNSKRDVSPEYTIEANKLTEGKGQMYVVVLRDSSLVSRGCRFLLNLSDPNAPSDVVVGVPKDWRAPSESRVAQYAGGQNK